MALSDALASETAVRRGSPCTVAALMGDLEAVDLAVFNAAMDGTTRTEDGKPVTSAAIARALTREGHRIGGETIQRHRKGECRCPR